MQSLQSSNKQEKLRERMATSSNRQFEELFEDGKQRRRNHLMFRMSRLANDYLDAQECEGINSLKPTGPPAHMLAQVQQSPVPQNPVKSRDDASQRRDTLVSGLANGRLDAPEFDAGDSLEPEGPPPRMLARVGWSLVAQNPKDIQTRDRDQERNTSVSRLASGRLHAQEFDGIGPLESLGPPPRMLAWAGQPKGLLLGRAPG